MNSVAILFFCTGEYVRFWENFYSSAEQHFLPHSKKQYFVFTDDAACIAKYESTDSVRCIYIPNLPWPFPSLLRYHFAINHLIDLQSFDYIVLANANLEVKKDVDEGEFLPRVSCGENYTFVDSSNLYAQCDEFPYERREFVTAFIPKGEGTYYVRGGLVAATAQAFAYLCYELDIMMRQDFHHRVFAIWHDESYLNRFALNRDDIRIVPGSVYLSGTDGAEVAILAVDKRSYMDVAELKGAPKSTSSNKEQGTRQ